VVVRPTAIVIGVGELAPGLAVPVGQAVRVARGEVLTFAVSLYHSDGRPWAGAAAEVRIFDAYRGRTPRVTVPLSRDRDTGLWMGTVAHTTTANWQPGVQLYWNCWTTDPEANQVIPLSLLTVLP